MTKSVITYDSNNILVSPSSKIVQFFRKIVDHISRQETQSRMRYLITVSGYFVLVRICSHQASNCASSVVWTQSWIRSHKSRKASMTKCILIALSTCHQQYNTWQPGYVAQIALTCA